MTDEDIKLIGDLQRELAGWQQRAQDAMGLAERNGVRITELETQVDRDATEIAALALKLGAADLRFTLRVTELEKLIEELRCGDLVSFAAGELAPDRAAAFREHLGRCADCRTGLETSMVIDATLSSSARPRKP